MRPKFRVLDANSEFGAEFATIRNSQEMQKLFLPHFLCISKIGTEIASSNEKSYPKISNKASNPWWGGRLLEMEKVCNITARLGLPAQNLDNQKRI